MILLICCSRKPDSAAQKEKTRCETEGCTGSKGRSKTRLFFAIELAHEELALTRIHVSQLEAALYLSSGEEVAAQDKTPSASLAESKKSESSLMSGRVESESAELAPRAREFLRTGIDEPGATAYSAAYSLLDLIRFLKRRDEAAWSIKRGTTAHRRGATSCGHREGLIRAEVPARGLTRVAARSCREQENKVGGKSIS